MLYILKSVLVLHAPNGCLNMLFLCFSCQKTIKGEKSKKFAAKFSKKVFFAPKHWFSVLLPEKSFLIFFLIFKPIYAHLLGLSWKTKLCRPKELRLGPFSIRLKTIFHCTLQLIDICNQSKTIMYVYLCLRLTRWP